MCVSSEIDGGTSGCVYAWSVAADFWRRGGESSALQFRTVLTEHLRQTSSESSSVCVHVRCLLGNAVRVRVYRLKKYFAASCILI